MDSELHRSILVLGASGMLGSAVFRFFASSPGWTVYGTARSPTAARVLPSGPHVKLVFGIDVLDSDRLIRLLGQVRPAIVLNCVGVIKQVSESKDPLSSIAINSLWPHRLAGMCGANGARLVHVSTDCVFSGRRGDYREDDFPDAEDLYGRTKLLGEVDYPHAVTLRTSLIGHEIESSVSLIDWFLTQPGPSVLGYRKAIYSGLPTVEFARVLRDVVAPRPELHGVWHLASAPINKYELLRLVAGQYGKKIEIKPDDGIVIDRSLDGSRFRQETGYIAPEWPVLVAAMHRTRPAHTP